MELADMIALEAIALCVEVRVFSSPPKLKKFLTDWIKI